MNKQEYMMRLRDGLATVDQALAKEILIDYEEHFTEGAKNGRSEEQICAELGDVSDLLQEIKGLNLASNIVVHSGTVPAEPERPAQPAALPKEPIPPQEHTEQACTSVAANLLSADVRIRRSLNGRVNVTYTNDGSERQKMAYQFECVQRGSCMYIDLKSRVTWKMFGLSIIENDIQVDIEVPDNFESIEVHNVSGDIQADAVSANKITLSSVSGEVTVRQSQALQAKLNSTSGDINVHGERMENLNVNTVSGDIHVSGSYGQCKMHSVSGDVNLKQAVVKQLQAKTTSGDVALCAKDSCDIIAGSMSGDITVYCDNGARGIKLDGSSVSGEVMLDYAGYRSSARRNCQYSYGDESIKIKANSMSGDINIRE